LAVRKWSSGTVKVRKPHLLHFGVALLEWRVCRYSGGIFGGIVYVRKRKDGRKNDDDDVKP